MKYPPHLLDEIRARLSVSDVVGRTVPLKRKGREFAGLSPFKTEKTPSFFVNDQKGFYHCFASGEHGDIFTFLMKTQGTTFPEAVEQLAGEAGVSLPKPQPRTRVEQQREDERTRLHRLVEAAAAFFQAALLRDDAAHARAYLEQRGLTAREREAFSVGYAPSGHAVLHDHLAQHGFSPAEMARAGMRVAGPDISRPYDRFRDRIMFPITDSRGRVIAFGGRALSKDVQAKYMNSPETPLFHKGRVLFNYPRAREAAYKAGDLLVVEGYMDVIALAGAGFAQAVAPLGTALTAEQIALLWRACPEPILCFDGDGAGRKAAYRAIDVALPLLVPGKSLRFAFMPDGVDPDDLVRAEGPAGLRRVLQGAVALSDVLFEREWAAGEGRWDTPERRAQLERNLYGFAGRIEDTAVRGHYERAIKDQLFHRFRRSPAHAKPGHTADPARGAGPGSGRWSGPGAPRGTGADAADEQWRNVAREAATPPSQRGRAPLRKLPQAGSNASRALRSSRLVANHNPRQCLEATILWGLVQAPWLLEDHAEAVADLALDMPPFIALRDEILTLHASHVSLDTVTLRTQVSSAGLQPAIALAERHSASLRDTTAIDDGERSQIERSWSNAVQLHQQQRGLQQELEDARRLFDARQDDMSFNRLAFIKRQLLELSGPS
ncbi:MAG: DNA primase [Pseudomonadota bacterium]